MNKNELTNDQITDIWEAMPGQPEGWLKQFGYIQFARAIEAEVASRLASKVGNASLEGLTRYEPSDDGMFRNNVSGEYVVFADVKRLLVNAVAPIPPLTAPAPLTDVKLQAAIKWLNSAQHGDNCFVSDHYEGDPGDRCNCGKDSLLEYLESDEAAPAPQQSMLTDERIAELNREAQDQAIRGIAPSIYLARAIEAEVINIMVRNQNPDVYGIRQEATQAPQQSDLTTVPCPVCAEDRNLMCDECDGQGRIIFSRKDLASIPAAPAAPVQTAEQGDLTDEAIDEVWRAMPGGVDGWLKQFGYRQFARSIARYTLVRVAASMAGTIRPTDDELWEQTIGERDHYHEWADKLADAIAKHFGAEIGEHSNMNCPWAEAMEVIEAAPVQADQAQIRDQALEEAALAAEKVREACSERDSRKWPELRDDAATGAGECADAIRALRTQSTATSNDTGALGEKGAEA